jgi:pyruvate/2-oxoglutarate dehydrogenase complex dihydrolipoamide acyltransferase (E2) component
MAAWGLMLGVSACSASTPPAPVASSTATQEAPPPAPASASVAAAPSAAPVATAAPVASAAPSADPVADAALPKVKVENIGMHIGGGPNDPPTKEPIRRSVAPHFDEFKRCYLKVDDQKKPGDFGVDLLIPKEGGKLKKLDRVRTTLSGEGFRDCVVQVFEGIEYLKPKGGLTKVSYSIRFTPER